MIEFVVKSIALQENRHQLYWWMRHWNNKCWQCLRFTTKTIKNDAFYCAKQNCSTVVAELVAIKQVASVTWSTIRGNSQNHELLMKILIRVKPQLCRTWCWWTSFICIILAIILQKKLWYDKLNKIRFSATVLENYKPTLISSLLYKTETVFYQFCEVSVVLIALVINLKSTVHWDSSFWLLYMLVCHMVVSLRVCQSAGFSNYLSQVKFWAHGFL